jgi:hypothetical protein
VEGYYGNLKVGEWRVIRGWVSGGLLVLYRCVGGYYG